MPPSVLFDQSNTVYRMGTGIATYARNLAIAAKRAGYATKALLSTEARVDLRNPVLAQAQLFDSPREPVLPWLKDFGDVIAGLGRASLGYRPTLLPQSDVVFQPSGSAQTFDQTYIGNRMFEAARAHFFAYGRFPVIRMPEPPALFHATHPLPVRIAGCPNVVTIHDLVPLRLPQMTLDNKRYFFRLVQHLVRQADHVITVSEYSRRDVVSLFGIPEQKITNIYQAVTIPSRALARTDDDVADQITNLFELDPGNYYLFIGALEPKKNVSRLIDAYAASGSRRPLIIAGGQGWQNKGDLERINDTRFSNYHVNENTIAKVKRVRRMPYLPADQLITLMRGARALLFPSLFEGFGLPVLEAMTLGTPVMTSNVTSLPEIAGDAALLVDPWDVSDMATAIRSLDNDVDLLNALSARGRQQARLFNMDLYVNRLEAVYRSVLHG